MELKEETGWRHIDSAPKDGRVILVLSEEYNNGTKEEPFIVAPKAFLVHWNPKGNSWVDEQGRLGRDCVTLADTGFWSAINGGWFQPNEVTHWMPIPMPPTTHPPKQI